MKRLLIVDDEEKICAILARFFSLRGFITQTALSGIQALDQLKEEVPDYLLLDIRMPGLSGLDVLKEAKARYPNLSVIMVTALDDAETAHQAIQCGATDFITKPLSFNDQSWARAFFAAG